MLYGRRVHRFYSQEEKIPIENFVALTKKVNIGWTYLVFELRYPLCTPLKACLCLPHGTYIRWYLRNRCVREEKNR